MSLFGMQVAAAVIKDVHNTMRSCDKQWNVVWRETDWAVLADLASSNRKERRAHGV